MGASVTLWEATAPVKLPTSRCPLPGYLARVRTHAPSGWYFTNASTKADASVSQAPTYPTQMAHAPNDKLE